MPIYGYKCDSCDHIFDRTLSMSENKTPTKEPCPNCNKKSVRQYHGTMPGFITQAGSTINKTSSDWKDLLKKIDKGAGRHSKVDNY